MLRSFSIIFVALAMVGSGFAQATFKSVQDGDWNDASTWTSGAGVGGTEGVDYPAASDNVIVDHYVIINATNSGSNFSFTGNLTINEGDTLESQVGDNVAGFVLEGNGLMRNFGSFFTLDVTEEPNETAHIPYEFVCTGNSVFIGGLNSFAFISDDWRLEGNAQVFIDNLLCYAVSDDVLFESTTCYMYGTGNIRIGGDGPNSTVEFNGGSTTAQLDDDITIWRNAASLACSGTAVVTGTNAGTIPPFAFDDSYVAALNTTQNQNVLYQGSVDFSPTAEDTITLSSAGSDAGATNGSTAQGGTVTVNNNGTLDDLTDDYIVYTPPTNFIGTDTYNYLITNEGGATDIATVTVTNTACGSGFIADTTLVAAASQSNNSGVDNPANVTGVPNAGFSDWYDDNDVLNVDFGQSYTAGTQYKITWRVRSGSTNAQPVIGESTTNGSFTTVAAAYIIADNTTQETIVTSENDFRFLQIEKDDGVDDTDFEIDAIEVLDISCLTDTDEDGVADGSDIDDDNDGIKDGDEPQCVSPEAYWNMDNTTDDATSNNHDERTDGNTPTFSTDAIQGTHSTSFNGTTHRIRYSQDGGFMEVVTSTISFSAWIKPTSVTGTRVIFEEGGSTNGFTVYLNAGVPTVSTRANSVQFNAASATTLTVDNQWHHIAGTFNNGVLTVYFDGSSNSATASYTSLPNHSSDGGVGCFFDDNPIGAADNTGHYAGLIDGAKYSDSEVWTTSEIDFNCDADGDGLANFQDLDSDNDGIADLVEAKGVDTDGDGRVDGAFSDTNNDGLHNTYDTDNGGDQISSTDTDGDGLSDAFDLDSDNDGIPDVVESGGTDANGDGRADDYVDTDEDGFNDVVDGNVGNDALAENTDNALLITEEDTDSDGIPNSYPSDDNDGDGILNHLDLDSDNDGIADVAEAGGTDENGDGRADDYTDADGDGFNDIVDGDPTNALAVGADGSGANTSNALTVTGADTDADGAPNSRPNDDFDGDSVFNFLDLDSDDDGILDVVEAGGTDANRDGQQDGSTDADNDGYNDSVDGDIDNSLSAGTDTDGGEQSNALTLTDEDADLDGVPDDYPNDDFDDDGHLNYLDIDADNDGIVDNTEGQPTTVAGGYVAPDNADADGDGIDDAYDTDDANFGGANSSFVLNDADASVNPATPDYLDLDSDNDEDLDSVEGHDTDNDGVADGSSPASTGLPGGTTDSDGDGLLDGFDNNTSSNDPTNGNLLGDSHPNLDNTSTTERDWREGLDFDLDGVPDFSDLDDDNDGIPDDEEDICAVYVTNEDAFWSFEGNTNDVSGNGRNQQAGTAPSFSVDAVQGSNSASFNGSTHVVQYSDGTFMNGDYTEISFSAWIKPSNLTGDRIIYEEGGGTNGATLWINSGVLTFSTRNSSNQTDVTHPTGLTVDNEWHHVACTFDNGVMTVYLDGVSNSGNTSPATSNIPSHGDAGGIGATSGSTAAGITGAFFEGLIDAARYSLSEAWSSADILAEAGSSNCDNDNDGVFNRFDLDSDNDGIPDIVEAGGEDTDGDGMVDDLTGATLDNDTDGDGLDDRYDSNNGGDDIPNADTDGDGILNQLDLDADNDGIPDVVEAGGTDANGDGRADDYTDTDGDGFNDVVDGDVGNDGTTENSGNALTLTGEDTDDDGGPDTYPNDDADGDGILNQFDLDADNDGVPDVVEAGGTDENGDGRADDYTDADRDGFNDIVDGDPTNALAVGADGSGANTSNALTVTGPDTDADGAPNSRPNDDFDGDAVFNFLDLDSDDDGILDVTEAGGTDANRDGQQDGSADADGDGYNDSVDGDTDNSLAVGTDTDGGEQANALTLTDEDADLDGAPDDYPNDDLDDDGHLNYLDIDADNDGLVDNTEGQPTTVAGGYVAPDNADADGDGIDDAYDSDDANFGGANSSFALNDADGSVNPATPDYLDFDSDNDGDLDSLEGHDTDNDGVADGSSPASTGLPGGSTDSDGDGLLDGYDNNTSSNDPTNGNLLGDSHPNLDNTATTEHDWREALDFDLDSIPDFTDLDDDNDGISDNAENACSQFVTNEDAFWPFEGNTNDVSGNGRNQQAGTAPSFSLDAVQGSNSVSFNGSTHVIQYSDGTFMNGDYTEISFSAWIKPSNLSGDRILYEEGGGTHGATFWINGGVLTFSTRNNSNQTDLVHPTALTVDNEWHHVACTFDNGVMTVYLDGVSSSGNTSPATTNIPAHGNEGGIGGDLGGSTSAGITGAFYEGLMDAARYSLSEAWSSTDIQAEANPSECDDDNDGVSNQFDLDSDNDGIPDIVEAGGEDTDGDGQVDDRTGTALDNDSDGDGLDDRYDSNNGGTDIANGDTDGDGRADIYDLDSDNDGIPDVVESGGTDENGDGRADDYTDTDGDGFNDVVDGDVGNDGTAENSGDALTRTGEDTDADGVPNTYPNDDNDGDGFLNHLDLDADNDGIADVVEAGGTDENGDGRADDYTDSDGDGFNDIVDGDPTNALAVGADGSGANTSNALTVTGPDTDADGAPNSRPNDDFDGDAVFNFLDLDSDDDGILDVTEAGGTDANRDGQQDGSTDADNDGYNDSVDGDIDNSLAVGTDTDGGEQTNALTLTDEDADLDGVPDDYPNDDLDGDGHLNYLDIDADNDGIVDNTEGQPTTVAGGYVSPDNADADGDGIDDAYDSDDANFGGANSSFVLNDADGSVNPATPDYLDFDSDNDGDLDSLEGHDTDNDGVADGSSPANTGLPGGTTDSDGDGLLDGYDNNTSSNDPTNGNLLGDSHPNLDVTSTAEHDWREALDNDLDGIPDVADIDDDNDGILDIDECTSDGLLLFDDVSGQTVASSVNGSINVTVSGGTVSTTSLSGGFNTPESNASYTYTFNTPLQLLNITLGSINRATEIGNFSITRQSGAVDANVDFDLSFDAADDSYDALINESGGNVNYSERLDKLTGAPFATGILFVDNPAVSGSNQAWGILKFTGYEADPIVSISFDISSGTSNMVVGLAGIQSCDADTDGDGVLNKFDLDSDNDGIPDIVEAGGTDANGDGGVDGVFSDGNGDGWSDVFDSVDGGTALADGDQDGDGFNNRIDLDADNDGIADIVEAGGTDANEDGRADAASDTDRDGWPDTFDSDDGGLALTVPNTDGDTVANYLDIDSDNDGITDNVEGQTTAAFQAPTGTDTDNDGWDNQYDSDDGGSAIGLSNNDGAGNPDYIDDDSDGDGLFDWTEGFDDDDDQDALLDFIARANTYETAAGNPMNYVSSDDGDADGIPDFLEDADGDDVPNFLDPDNGSFYLDTDGDGLVDLFDADNNGVASSTPDGDGDGEYDFRDGDNQITLPISLVSFKAIKEGDRVRLSWSTATETNNDYFTIERSLDGTTFEPLLVEDGAGNSSKEQHYLRYDERPFVGYNYYRLRQTDFDGRSETFNIEVVHFNGNQALNSYKVYPNPTDGRKCYFEIENVQRGTYQLEVLSGLGKMVHQQTLVFDTEQLVYSVDFLQNLPLASGIYYLRFGSEQTNHATKFVVQ